MRSISSNHLRGHVETLILAALDAGPAHGLGILKHLEDAGCGLLKLREGSLYPALYRLEAAGQAKSFEQPVPAGQKGAVRRMYCITRKGRRTLAQNRQEWQQFVTVVNKILGTVPCPNLLPAN